MTGQRIMTLVNRRKALQKTSLKLHREKPKELSITNKKPVKLVYGWSVVFISRLPHIDRIQT